MAIPNLEAHQKSQDIAKRTMARLNKYIKKGVSEAEIAEEARKQMEGMGASFWYYKPALALVGKRTKISVSGKDYTPSDRKVSRTDLVTVDLSPQIDGCWGDYARSFLVADGVVKDRLSPSHLGPSKKLMNGICVENDLHEWLMQKVRARPAITFGELCLGARRQAEFLGYRILDFKGNVGHTIEKELDQRVYIEEGCERRVSDTGLFTFEPHIGKGNYGFKREDIYYFSEGRLKRL